MRVHSPLRVIVVCLFIVTGAASTPVALAAPSRPTLPVTTAVRGATQLFTLVNDERASAGLPALQWREDVATIAMTWSAVMAGTGRLAHNDAYFSEAARIAIGSSARGENVAFAGSPEAAHYAFMNSPGHRANILDPDFTEAGFGAFQDVSGKWWWTQDFARPAGAPAQAAPPVEPPAEPDPEPEPVATVADVPAQETPRAAPPPTTAAASAPTTTSEPFVPTTLPPPSTTPAPTVAAPIAVTPPIATPTSPPFAIVGVTVALLAAVYGAHVIAHRRRRT